MAFILSNHYFGTNLKIKMKRTKVVLTAIALALIDISCETSSKEQETEQTESVLELEALDYGIIDKQKSETSNKAQIKVLAYLKQDPTDQEDLKKTVE